MIIYINYDFIYIKFMCKQTYTYFCYTNYVFEKFLFSCFKIIKQIREEKQTGGFYMF